MSQIEIDKVNTLVLPALIKDKLIKETVEGYSPLIEGLLLIQ